MASAQRFVGAVSSPVVQSAATWKQRQTECACLCTLGSKSEKSITRIQSPNVAIGLPSLQQSILHSVVVTRRSRLFQCAAEDASAEPSAALPKELKTTPKAASKPTAEASKRPTFSSFIPAPI